MLRGWNHVKGLEGGEANHVRGVVGGSQIKLEG